MFTSTIRQALATMRLHRLWAGLTMFGIVWGTASVVFLVGWGIGVHRMVDTGLQKVGKNLMWILPGRIGKDLSPADERRILTFDMDDVEAVRAEARRAEVLSAEVYQWMYASAPAGGRNVDVRGVEPVMRDLVGVRLAEGRFLSPADLRLRRHVVVIGQTARERLLGSRRAVGSFINLNGQGFEVIGLLQRVGVQLSRNRSLVDEQLWTPITTAMTMAGTDVVNAMVTRPPARNLNDALKSEVRRILGRRLHVSPTDPEAVFIISSVDYLSAFDSIFVAMNIFLGLLAITTLFIGGIGVMNMMLVSVNERRREIGLRLAVGARQRDVVGQFLIETLVITLLGGGVGLAFGLLGCAGLNQLPKDVIPVPVIHTQVAGLAIVVTTVVGVLSGIGPAWRAARVDPAESLRAA